MTIQACQKLLLDQHINPVSTIEYEVNGRSYTLSLEWIIEQYMAAQPSSQKLFYESLSSVCKEGKKSVEKYFQDMGQLILMTSLSEVDNVKSF